MARGAAVTFVERRVLRPKGLARLLLVGTVALGSAATMATAAGGRRAATSYDRFLEWSHAPDGLVAFAYGLDSDQADEAFRRIETMPEIASATRIVRVDSSLGVRGRSTAPFREAAATVALGATDFRVKVLDGAVPDPSDPAQAAVDTLAADALDAAVGDVVELTFATDDAPPRVVPVTITAVVAAIGSFPTMTDTEPGGVLLTPAFAAAHPDDVDWSNATLVVGLRDDLAFAEFEAALRAVEPDAFAGALEAQSDGVRRLMRTQAAVLWFASAVLAAATAVVALQLVRRQATSRARELSLAHSLGMSRRDVAAAGALLGARAGCWAATVAVAGAIALSPLFPVGSARDADPSPGVHADLVVLVLGALVVVVVCTVAGATAVRGAFRAVDPNVLPRRRRPRRLAGTATQPAVMTGIRAALARPPSASGAPIRVGVVAIAVVIAALFATLTARANVDRLLVDPSLSGATWDATFTFQLDDEDAELADQVRESERGARALAADPAVRSSVAGGWVDVFVEGMPLYVAFIEPDADVGLAIDAGRAPVASDEIALGSAALAALDVEIGDSVEVVPASEEGPAPIVAVVTGRTILVSPVDRQLGPGGGGAVSTAMMERFGYPVVGARRFAVLRNDRDLDRVTNEVRDRTGSAFAYARAELSTVGVLRDLRALPIAVAAVLALMAAAAVLQRMFTSTRAHARRLAVLRTLGFTSGQVSTVGAVQGLTLAGAAAVVGAPLGGLVGVFVWRRLADYLNVLGSVSVPAGVMSIALLAWLAACVVAGTAVARRTSREPAWSLRGE